MLSVDGAQSPMGQHHASLENMFTAGNVSCPNKPCVHVMRFTDIFRSYSSVYSIPARVERGPLGANIDCTE